MRPVLTVVLLFLNSMQLNAQTNRRAESAIRKQVTALESAWNKHDAAALAAVYASDGDAILKDSPVVTGRPALQASAAADMANQSSTLRISITPTSLRFLSPDVAIVNTVAHFNEGSVREDRGSWIFVRRKGQWLVAALRVLPAEHK